MKSLRTIFCFIVAFSFISPSYAEEPESIQVETKQESDIKSGDELVITETIDQLNKSNEEIKDPLSEPSKEIKPQNPAANKIPAETEKNIEKEKNNPESKPAPTYQNTGPKRDGGVTAKPDDKEKTSEKPSNNKDQDPFRKVQKQENINKNNKPKDRKNSKKNPSKSKVIPSPKIKKTSSEAMDYKKSVDLASDAIRSSNLSKKDSKIIETQTKSIVKEYNKKIESAKSDEDKKKLAKEASQKIDQAVREVSPKAYRSFKDKQEPTIYDQKNQILVLEIDEDMDIEKALEGNDDFNKEKKPSKDASEQKDNPYFYLGVSIVLILGLSITMALRHRLKNKVK